MYRLYAPVVSAVSAAFTVDSDVSPVRSAVIYTTGYSSASFAIYGPLLYRLYLRSVGLYRLHIWPGCSLVCISGQFCIVCIHGR